VQTNTLQLINVAENNVEKPMSKDVSIHAFIIIWVTVNMASVVIFLTH
jgi:hypothetical protein